MIVCLNLVSISVIKTMSRGSLGGGGNGVLAHTSTSLSLMAGSHGRNPREWKPRGRN